MAWYPGASRMELRPEATQSAIRPTQFIVHSLAAPWTAKRTFEYWRDSTNLESHFGIGYAGDVGQYLSTTTRADANAAANRRSDGTGAISIETASNTTASDPWTPEQVQELIALGVWAHLKHGIPLRICRDAADPGFGWHRLHRAWSTSGTACPGPARIAQFQTVVFPGIVAAAQKTTNPTVPEEADEMPTRNLFSTTDGHMQRITPGTWRTLTFDRVYEDGSWRTKKAEQTILSGGSLYTGGFAIRVQGLAKGQELQLRFAHNARDSKGVFERAASMPIDSPTQAGGAGHFTYHWSAQLGGAHDDRLVCDVLVLGDGGPVTVDWARAEVLSWKA